MDDDIVGSPYFSLASSDISIEALESVQTSATSPFDERVCALTKNLVSTSIERARSLVSCYIDNDLFCVQVKMPYRPYSSIKSGSMSYQLKILDSVEFKINRDMLSDINYRRAMAAATGAAIIDMCLVYRALTDMFLNTLISSFHGNEKKKDTIAFEIGDGLIDFSLLKQEELTSIKELLLLFESPDR
tara:strand:- start:867 stop:1430 length:564 start_codon:yes stop_codon:yes gene_type:complete